MKIAYSGIEGAFAHTVAKRIFPDDTPVPFSNFKETYEAVVSSECDMAVLPIDNSYSGEVTEVMDLLFDGGLSVNALYSLPVTQNLLGVKGALISDIQKVVSHPKALEQCDEYIRNNGYEAIQASNTARAAKEVAKLHDKSVAAIASIETAEIYGLNVLDEKINESDDNTTRFVVVSNSADRIGLYEKKASFIMMFTVNDSAGALLRPLQVIAKHDFNMKVLHSRPLKRRQWEYYFYVEIEGDHTTPEGMRMKEELREVTSYVKILGPNSI